MNNIDLKNRNAVVTGGAQGFGLAIVKRFVDSGAMFCKMQKAIYDKYQKDKIKLL